MSVYYADTGQQEMKIGKKIQDFEIVPSRFVPHMSLFRCLFLRAREAADWEQNRSY